MAELWEATESERNQNSGPTSQINKRERLDLRLVRLGWAPSRRIAGEFIKSGKVTVNGRRLPKGATISSGDDVRVLEPLATLILRPNPDLKLEVLFEDPSVLVVNKPELMACHPLRGDEDNTVMNALAASYPEVAKAGERPLEGGLVHRLDNGTSGALIVARDHAAFTVLRSAIRRGQIGRRYLALCEGHLRNPCTIAAPIAHHPKNQRKMVAVKGRASPKGARAAFTQVRPLRHYAHSTLIELRPLTGCRHQIRVHLSSIGHPLACDVLYGGSGCGLAQGRFWLHLFQLAFDSPSTTGITVAAPLPADLATVLAGLHP
jgi:23S rRNA pseudouridine1911/1915/1917 synthase